MKQIGAIEYEQHVAAIVREMRSFRKSRVYTNRQFEGIRQPGSYEIDIAVELRLCRLLKFLLIIECKNWKRPVDRPVIQKLVQTRDAIAAQKAAVVSPVGFTKEAVDVARSNGVALWVVAQKSKEAICIMGLMPPSWWKYKYARLRIELADLLRLKDVQNEWRVIRYWAIDGPRMEPPYEYYDVYGSATTGYEDVSGVNRGRAVTEVMNSLLEYVHSVESLDTDTAITRKVRSWILKNIEGLTRRGLTQEKAEEMIGEVLKGE